MSKSLEAIGYRVVKNIKALHVYTKVEILKYENQLYNAKKAGVKLAKTIKLRYKTKDALEKLHYKE